MAQTGGLIGINYIDNFNLFWGRFQGRWPADLELKYWWMIFGSACDIHLPGLRWCTLTHSNLSTTKSKHHSLNLKLIKSSNSSSLHSPSPLPHPCQDSLIKWKNWLKLALNTTTPRHCVGSVTPTFIIMNTGKRDNSSLLLGLTRLNRPARSPKARLISPPPPPLLGIALTSWDQRLRKWMWCHWATLTHHLHSNQNQGNLLCINADKILWTGCLLHFHCPQYASLSII